MFRTALQLGAVTLCAVLIPGCTQNSNRTVAVYPVDGQLIFRGKPAVDAIVAFHPTVTDGSSVTTTAEVDFNGHFVVAQPDGAVGLPEGVYKLTATWPDDDRDRFNGKYADPAKPLLEISVKPGINLLPPINLD